MRRERDGAASPDFCGDGVVGLPGRESQRRGGGEPDSGVLGDHHVGRLHTSQRATSCTGRHRGFRTLGGEEHRHHDRFGVGGQSCRLAMVVAQRKTESAEMSAPLIGQVGVQGMAARRENPEHPTIKPRSRSGGGAPSVGRVTRVTNQ